MRRAAPIRAPAEKKRPVGLEQATYEHRIYNTGVRTTEPRAQLYTTGYHFCTWGGEGNLGAYEIVCFSPESEIRGKLQPPPQKKWRHPAWVYRNPIFPTMSYLPFTLKDRNLYRPGGASYGADTIWPEYGMIYLIRRPILSFLCILPTYLLYYRRG